MSVHSSDQVMTSQMTPSHMPFFLTRNLVWCIFLASSCVFASSSTSHTPILVCFRTTFRPMLRLLPLLIHKGPLFFRLWLELFTVLSSGRSRPHAAYTSSLSCCIVFALASAINPSSSNAPSFANSSAFSLPWVTNFSKCDISFFFLSSCGQDHDPGVVTAISRRSG